MGRRNWNFGNGNLKSKLLEFRPVNLEGGIQIEIHNPIFIQTKNSSHFDVMKINPRIILHVH